MVFAALRSGPKKLLNCFNGKIDLSVYNLFHRMTEKDLVFNELNKHNYKINRYIAQIKDMENANKKITQILIHSVPRVWKKCGISRRNAYFNIIPGSVG